MSREGMEVHGKVQTITIGSLVSMAVHSLTLAMAVASFAYSYGSSNSNIAHLERGRLENATAIIQLRTDNRLLTEALSDLRVATATLNQQIVALRSDLDLIRRNGRPQ